jgi:hypothetical protein
MDGTGKEVPYILWMLRPEGGSAGKSRVEPSRKIVFESGPRA